MLLVLMIEAITPLAAQMGQNGLEAIEDGIESA